MTLPYTGVRQRQWPPLNHFLSARNDLHILPECGEERWLTSTGLLPLAVIRAGRCRSADLGNAGTHLFGTCLGYCLINHIRDSTSPSSVKVSFCICRPAPLCSVDVRRPRISLTCWGGPAFLVYRFCCLQNNTELRRASFCK